MEYENETGKGAFCKKKAERKKKKNWHFSSNFFLHFRYVFFMDVSNPFTSKCICVNQCPDKEQDTLQDVQLYSTQTGSYLCEYDIPLNEYTQQTSSAKGPCPVVPVPAR